MRFDMCIWLGLWTLALGLATSGCPTASDDDSAGDDDTTSDEPLPLPVLEGDCHRYAFLEHANVTLDFDGDSWTHDYDVEARPDQGQLCEQRTSGDQLRELCYECDLLGVHLVREKRIDSPGNSSCITHANTPTIWPADADVGSTWTTEFDSRWVDCDTGAHQTDVAYTEEHEVVDRKVTAVPAGEGEVLTVSTVRSDGDHSETTVRWIGAGLGPIMAGETEDDPYQWLAEVRVR